MTVAVSGAEEVSNAESVTSVTEARFVKKAIINKASRVTLVFRRLS